MDAKKRNHSPSPQAARRKPRKLSRRQRRAQARLKVVIALTLVAVTATGIMLITAPRRSHKVIDNFALARQREAVEAPTITLGTGEEVGRQVEILAPASAETTPDAAEAILKQLSSDELSNYMISGVVLTENRGDETVAGFPIVADLAEQKAGAADDDRCGDLRTGAGSLHDQKDKRSSKDAEEQSQDQGVDQIAYPETHLSDMDAALADVVVGNVIYLSLFRCFCHLIHLFFVCFDFVFVFCQVLFRGFFLQQYLYEVFQEYSLNLTRLSPTTLHL